MVAEKSRRNTVPLSFLSPLHLVLLPASVPNHSGKTFFSPAPHCIPFSSFSFFLLHFCFVILIR